MAHGLELYFSGRSLIRWLSFVLCYPVYRIPVVVAFAQPCVQLLHSTVDALNKHRLSSVGW